MHPADWAKLQPCTPDFPLLCGSGPRLASREMYMRLGCGGKAAAMFLCRMWVWGRCYLQLMHSVAGWLACLVYWVTFEATAGPAAPPLSRHLCQKVRWFWVYPTHDLKISLPQFHGCWQRTQNPQVRIKGLYDSQHKRQQELHVCAYSFVPQSPQGPCQMAWHDNVHQNLGILSWGEANFSKVK